MSCFGSEARRHISFTNVMPLTEIKDRRTSKNTGRGFDFRMCH